MVFSILLCHLSRTAENEHEGLFLIGVKYALYVVRRQKEYDALSMCTLFFYWFLRLLSGKVYDFNYERSTMKLTLNFFGRQTQ